MRRYIGFINPASEFSVHTGEDGVFITVRKLGPSGEAVAFGTMTPDEAYQVLYDAMQFVLDHCVMEPAKRDA